MTDERRDALERLERRVEVLEQMMRRLLAAAPAAPAAPAVPPLHTTRPSPPHSRAFPVPETPAPPGEPRTTDLEQWFGQRGLLGVGVVALLAAAGFFLKYAFDRGWVPPGARAVLAVVAGSAVAAWGEQRIRGSMRRYGAAIVGAGSGVAYLGLWAAAGPYALVDRRLGVLLLAASTVIVTLLARRHEIEDLAIWALAGAYLAPLLLPPPAPHPEAFLGYLEVIVLGTGVLAHAMSWRRTFDLAVGGYVALTAAGASAALSSALGCWLVAAAAVLTLHVTSRHAWPEARLGAAFLTWWLLGWGLSEVLGPQPTHWLAAAAAVPVSGLLWWQQLERDPFAPGRTDAGAAADRLLFVANPVALLLLAYAARLKPLEEGPGLLPALLGAIYLSAGWLRRAAPVFVMGFALVAVAMARVWPAASVVIGWTALAGVALAAERRSDRPGGRMAAVGLATAALVCLVSVALWSRAPAAPVFSDGWALALYGYVGGTALAARWWGAPAEGRGWKPRGGEVLWALCGAAVFIGGSIELWRYFGRLTRLAGDLALSVFWLLYAGALVQLGFQLSRKDVRSAGLVVAAGAGLKIVLYDLSNLEALYRIASFFALALIALGVAYVYNKKPKAAG